MSSLEDILFEWGRGPFRLSTDDSLVVMARLTELEEIQTRLRAQLGNAVGAIIDTGNHYCTGPADVADAIYRLTAERDSLKAEIAYVGDPSRTSRFETDGDQIRTVTYTAWRPLWWCLPLPAAPEEQQP